MGGGPDEWLSTIKKCQYLSEPDMKKLCEKVRTHIEHTHYYNNIYFAF
jgi:hypothetical protein